MYFIYVSICLHIISHNIFIRKTVAAIGLDGDSGLASLEGFLPKIANKCLRILKRCKTAVAKDKAASMTEVMVMRCNSDVM